MPDVSRALVLDAGAALNLLATGRPRAVLQCLAHKIVMEEMSAARLTAAPPQSPLGRGALDDLARQGTLSIERLDAVAYDTFLQLVAATPPGDLGDGDAAAVALAISCGGDLVVDEPKTARIAEALLGRAPLHTLDLVAAPAVLDALGQTGLAEALAAAARMAHIRVPPRFRGWVADLLGLDPRVLDAPTARWAALITEHPQPSPSVGAMESHAAPADPRGPARATKSQ